MGTRATSLLLLSDSCDMFDPMNSLPFSWSLSLWRNWTFRSVQVRAPEMAEQELQVILLFRPPSPRSLARSPARALT